jgi:flavin reductase (DIM6/NTAB) family NADH-FMN oxidoreductase RutF
MDKHHTCAFTHDELMSMEQSLRVNIINSILGFKSVALIGSINDKKESNLAIFSSIVHLGASPPLIGVVVRPDCVDRHTLTNIMETASFTINHINENIMQQAHQTSARYPKEISEFDATQLTEEYKGNCKAPFVKESYIQMAVSFREKHELSINACQFVIGEIQAIYFPKECFCVDGFIDIEKAQSITCSGLDRYHRTQHLARLSYAKVDKNLSSQKLEYKYST